jgi:hypothetical protein
LRSLAIGCITEAAGCSRRCGSRIGKRGGDIVRLLTIHSESLLLLVLGLVYKTRILLLKVMLNEVLVQVQILNLILVLDLRLVVKGRTL